MEERYASGAKCMDDQESVSTDKIGTSVPGSLRKRRDSLSILPTQVEYLFCLFFTEEAGN